MTPTPRPSNGIPVGKFGKVAHTLPPEVQTVTTAILGIRGSGKSTTARVIVEGLVKQHRQVAIIDPTDVWHGLTSSADGRKPGLPVIVAGGAHGHVPLTENDGATMADFIVQDGASVVLSLRHLRKGGQRQFVTAFAEQLYHRKGSDRSPVLVVIDECDAFVPQRVGSAEARMVGSIEDLVRRGRAAGIGVMLISQRAASVNKDVLTQIELLVAHRHTSPQDRKALEAWVEAHDTRDRLQEFMKALASLKRGSAWFWSPGWLDLFTPIDVWRPETFDSSATPGPGQATKTPKAMAEVDLEALRAKLSATIAEAEANDPRKLKAEIAALKAAAAKARPEADPEAVRRAVAAAVAQRDEEWHRAFDEYANAVVQAARARVAAPGQPLATYPAAVKPALTTAAPRPAKTVAPPSGVAGAAQLSGLERALLTVLAQHPAGLTKGAACTYASYAPSGPVSVAWARFAAEGWVQRTADGVRITEAGLAALGSYEPLPTGEALRDHWIAKSSPLEAALLQALFARPDGATKGELVAAAGYKPSGPVSTAWGKFNRLGWTQRTANGLKPAAMWFEE